MRPSFPSAQDAQASVLHVQVVLSKPTPDARVEDGEFEENEAWALDIVLSTGEGKPKARPSHQPQCSTQRCREPAVAASRSPCLLTCERKTPLSQAPQQIRSLECVSLICTIGGVRRSFWPFDAVLAC